MRVAAQGRSQKVVLLRTYLALLASAQKAYRAAEKHKPRGKGKPTIPPKKVSSVAPTPAAPVAETDAPMTVLVFQDGHRTEARNYAIVGQTLWIYTEQDSKKVPFFPLGWGAEACDTIAYEVLTSVGKRVPRVYVEDFAEDVDA